MSLNKTGRTDNEQQSDHVEVVKKTRKSFYKVKTGCLTCKLVSQILFFLLSWRSYNANLLFILYMIGFGTLNVMRRGLNV